MNLFKWAAIPKEQAEILGIATLLTGDNSVWPAISTSFVHFESCGTEYCLLELQELP